MTHKDLWNLLLHPLVFVKREGILEKLFDIQETQHLSAPLNQLIEPYRT